MELIKIHYDLNTIENNLLRLLIFRCSEHTMFFLIRLINLLFNRFRYNSRHNLLLNIFRKFCGFHVLIN